MLTGIQIILLLIIFLLFTRTVFRLRDGTIRQGSFLGWTILWVLGGIVVLYPDVTGKVAEIVGVGRGVDVVVYVAVLVLFYLLFKTYNRTIIMEKEITKLVRKVALKDDEENNEEVS